MKRKDFIPGEQHLYAHSILIVPQSKADQTSLLFPLHPVQPEKASKNTFATRTSQNEENWNWKIKSPIRCYCGRGGFLYGLVGSYEIKLENTSMKQEIADMKQEIADMKLEKAG